MKTSEQIAKEFCQEMGFELINFDLTNQESVMIIDYMNWYNEQEQSVITI